jgi:hypothetical protein
MPDHPLPALSEREARPAPCRLASWTPWHQPNPSLVGHCDVVFAGGWRINGVPVFRRGDGSWSAGAPTSPQIDRDGRQRTDLAGKRLYSPLLQFETAQARERWQSAVLGALAAAGIAATADAAA